MRSFFKFCHSRPALVLGVCALALTQAACAHPVVVEPSVVVQARLGGPVYGSIYAPLYGPPPVVVAPPPPVWLAPPPTVVMPYGAWVPPGHRHRHWHGRHQDHDGWERREGFRR